MWLHECACMRVFICAVHWLKTWYLLNDEDWIRVFVCDFCVVRVSQCVSIRWRFKMWNFIFGTKTIRSITRTNLIAFFLLYYYHTSLPTKDIRLIKGIFNCVKFVQECSDFNFWMVFRKPQFLNKTIARKTRVIRNMCLPSKEVI